MNNTPLAIRALCSAAFAAAAMAATAAAIGAVAAATAPATAAADVLKTPAAASALAQRALINGLAKAGSRLVAVGQRGHILYSDNGGQSWNQAKVPVSSDLTAVSFPSAQQGWAVGHDGVVLHTQDGGANWTLQLDGSAAAQAVLAHLTTQGADGRALEDARRLVEQGPDKPFLDVWFEDDARGFVVGAFGLIFQTIDGGKNWLPAQASVDNPRGFHLNAIRPSGGATYIVGEQGMVLRRAPGAARFTPVNVAYKGSFFGVTGNDDAVMVYGLRGNAYRSADQGATWQKIETGLQAGLTAATVNGKQFTLVSQGGQVLLSEDSGATFSKVAGARPGPVSAALVLDKDNMLLGGARGLRAQSLAAAVTATPGK